VRGVGRRAGLLAGSVVFAALAAWLPPAAASASDLTNLLSSLGPAPAGPAGSIDVIASVDRSGGRSELVVSLVPMGNAKLVTDPGITVDPVPAANVRWRTGGPVKLTEDGAPYFAAPPTLRVPFDAESGKVGAKVEYAYCIVDQKCLFGETSVSVPVTPAGG
jgi:hypothetical protein